MGQSASLLQPPPLFPPPQISFMRILETASFAGMHLLPNAAQHTPSVQSASVLHVELPGPVVHCAWQLSGSPGRGALQHFIPPVHAGLHVPVPGPPHAPAEHVLSPAPQHVPAGQGEAQPHFPVEELHC